LFIEPADAQKNRVRESTQPTNAFTAWKSVRFLVEDGKKGKTATRSKKYHYPYYSRNKVRLYLVSGTCGPLAERTGKRNLSLSERTGSQIGRSLDPPPLTGCGRGKPPARIKVLPSAKGFILKDLKALEELEVGQRDGRDAATVSAVRRKYAVWSMVSLRPQFVFAFVCQVRPSVLA
jgi:hypothetical protein